jgi:hypothetical protein
MKVKQFQELYFISKGEDIDFDKSIKMVGVLTGKVPEQVEAMKMKAFNKQCAKIVKAFEIFGKDLMNGKPSKYLFVNGRIYRLNYDLQKASKYVEGITFAKDIINDIHKLLATIAEPINWRGKVYHMEHADIAKDMENVEFEAAYHAAVFFYLQYQILMQVIQPYLVQEATKKGANKETVTEALVNFNSLLDGFTMPRWSVNLKEYLLMRFGI